MCSWPAAQGISPAVFRATVVPATTTSLQVFVQVPAMALLAVIMESSTSLPVHVLVSAIQLDVTMSL